MVYDGARTIYIRIRIDDGVERTRQGCTLTWTRATRPTHYAEYGRHTRMDGWLNG